MDTFALANSNESSLEEVRASREKENKKTINILIFGGFIHKARYYWSKHIRKYLRSFG